VAERSFSEAEIEYMGSQRLGRLATVGKDRTPHVVPVSFRANPELGTIDIGGHGMGQSKKYADVQREGRAAFVVDDVLPPWRPRGIEVRGRAEVLTDGGQDFGPGFAPEMIRIWPERTRAWGIESDAIPGRSG
jgi:pyridoxamine 5'-phosphate oxidase family protein